MMKMMFEEALVDKKGVGWEVFVEDKRPKEWGEGSLHRPQHIPNEQKEAPFIFLYTLFSKKDASLVSLIGL